MDWVRPRKFELALLVAIVGGLVFVLLTALERTREDVESSAVQTEVAALRVELLDRLTHRELYGGMVPDSRNPMLWVARRPAGYLGEIDTVPVEGGVWYFDRSRQALVYRFRSGRESCYKLVRGGEAPSALGQLSGIGLRQLGEVGKCVK
ncbi:hypothetical protein [Propionivibrio dicarboxylicus]|uniref:Uncharacterized protein n=1 Tax=Propionivibrio dicarboxylicus TaxID=83767 RepID=A0A1G8IHZ5_9RHOO|nr:hypothetical protein [Propionivibrio dicarboxylicus]SDI18629.1 hypothetical protein SAMN05660652_03002 [Propionivibrio dicarboxylicus]